MYTVVNLQLDKILNPRSTNEQSSIVHPIEPVNETLYSPAGISVPILYVPAFILLVFLVSVFGASVFVSCLSTLAVVSVVVVTSFYFLQNSKLL